MNPTPPVPAAPDDASLRSRLLRLWTRHRTLFWVLHSVWALATGILVIFLARERYGFLPWVAAFLILTWASTMYFGHRTSPDATGKTRASEKGSGPPALTLMDEVTSYLNRIMYQETLFFLLPFYAYSTVFGSRNVLFLVLLGVLALVSCLDLVFDRWLDASRVFSLVFFGTVAFAAINLVLPMLLGLPPRLGTPVAAVLAVAAGTALALRGARAGAVRWRVGIAALAILGMLLGRPEVVPPVPLRLQDVVFTPSLDRETLTPGDTLGSSVAATALPQGLMVLVRVFAPSAIPAHVTVEWRRDGATVRTSDEISVVAHEAGFRIWDALRPGPEGLRPGRYRLILWTRGRRVFGVADIVVQPG